MLQKNNIFMFVTIVVALGGCSKIRPIESALDTQRAQHEDSKLKSFENTLDKLQDDLEEQRQRLAKQERRLKDQEKVIAKQERVVEQQRQDLGTLREERIVSPNHLGTLRGAGQSPSHRANDLQKDTAAQQDVKQSDKQEVNNGEQPHPDQKVPKVGTQEQAEGAKAAEKPQAQGGIAGGQETTRPGVAAIPEIGGVLTPRGRLLLEPALQYTHSSLSRFTFQGVEIIPAFLVGLLQAEDSDRDLISPQLTVRYGITNRLELEAKAPYVYRDDKITSTIPPMQTEGETATSVDSDVDGKGLGDVEVALHYQINRGLNGWPFFVGNVRYKSTTGEGPFDVERDSMGQESEAPTGSGFHSVEPSLTVLYPSDPAVFFANVGYLINLEKDVDKSFNQVVENTGEVVSQTFGDVDPGNALRISFGMGYSLNESASVTLGYKQDFIRGTDFEINGDNVRSEDLNVGSLLLGWGFSLTDRVATNINLELGITQDAPDVLLTFRVPFVAYQF